MSEPAVELRVCEMGRRMRRRPASALPLHMTYDLQSSKRLGRVSLLLMTDTEKSLKRTRWWIAVMVAGLLLSGVTAFPLQTEVAWLHRVLASSAMAEQIGLLTWIARVDAGLTVTYATYPFLAYGTDWLAFAHVAIAAMFIGPWMNPVRNRWVFVWGLIACAGVIPLALIAGPVRGIPLGWRMVDCSFGVVGCVPMWMCLREARRLGQRDCPTLS